MLTRQAARPRHDTRQYEFRLVEPLERPIAVFPQIQTIPQIQQSNRRRITAWLYMVWSTVIVIEIALVWAAIALDIIY
jgi:hypothetical protein